jgi:hypothetical protein
VGGDGNGLPCHQGPCSVEGPRPNKPSLNLGMLMQRDASFCEKSKRREGSRSMGCLCLSFDRRFGLCQFSVSTLFTRREPQKLQGKEARPDSLGGDKLVGGGGHFRHLRDSVFFWSNEGRLREPLGSPARSFLGPLSFGRINTYLTQRALGDASPKKGGLTRLLPVHSAARGRVRG